MTTKKRIIQKRIEMLSVNFLRDSFLESERIEPRIEENDKEPSWDGNVFLYSTYELKKDDVIKIPVQVKGRFHEGEYSESIKYDLKKNDLINYRNHNGVLFLIVYTRAKNDCMVYYNDLFSSDINVLLEKMGEQSQIREEFKHFDMSSVHSIEALLLNFHGNRIKHSPSDIYIKDFDRFDAEVMEFVVFPGEEAKVIFEAMPVYGKLSEFPNKYFPVTRRQLKSISSNIPARISVNDECFYNEITVTYTKDTNLLKIGGSFIWSQHNNHLDNPSNSDVSIRFAGGYKKRYQDIKFVDALLESGGFEIDGDRKNLPSAIEVSQEDRSILKKQVDYYGNINLLYKILNVQKDLDVESMSDKDISMLDRMIGYFVNGDKKAFSINNNGLLRIQISNLIFKFYAVELEDNRLEITDIFDSNTRLRTYFKGYEDETETHSFLLSLTRTDLCELCNIDTQLIYERLVEDEKCSKKYLEVLTIFMLEAIHAYDRDRSKELLKLAGKLNDFLMKKQESKLIPLINSFQLIAWERALNNQELEQIAMIKKRCSKNGESDEIMLALNILSKSKKDAEIYLKGLTKESRAIFEAYPIFKLYKKLCD